MKRRVVVTGTGIATTAPDSAVVRLAVADEADDVSAALAGVGALVGRVGTSLREHAVDGRDIKTSSLSVYPRYDNDGQPTAGFRAQHQVSVRVRELSRLGDVVAAAVTAGDNKATIDSVSLGLLDPATLETQAREAAFIDARRKASELAGHADAELSSVVSVAEVSSQGFEPRAFKLAAADSGMPIEAGEETVTVTVEVTFALA